MVAKIPKYSNETIYDLKNKGFHSYVIDGKVFLSTYEHVYRTIYIDGVKTKYIIDRTGNVYNSISKRRLKPVLSSGGYYRITLQLGNGEYAHPAIHRLVALAFIPNPENKPDVNHKDGNKSHNYVENLEWVTKSENIRHAFKTGLMNHQGSKNARAKLDEKIVHLIWDDIHDDKNSKKMIEIANKYKIPKSTLTSIYHGRSWKTIYDERHKPSDVHLDKKYTDDQIRLAKQLMREKTKPIKEISAITGITNSYLYNIRQNKYRKDI